MWHHGSSPGHEFVRRRCCGLADPSPGRGGNQWAIARSTAATPTRTRERARSPIRALRVAAHEAACR